MTPDPFAGPPQPAEEPDDAGQLAGDELDQLADPDFTDDGPDADAVLNEPLPGEPRPRGWPADQSGRGWDDAVMPEERFGVKPGDPPPDGWEWSSGTRGTPQLRRIYDWEAIRRTYVEGVKVEDTTGGRIEYPSLQAVAERFGVVIERVKEKSSKQGWVEQRRQWQAQVEATRQQARANALAKRGLKVDTTALEAAEAGLTLLRAKLLEIGQAARTARSNAGPGGTSGGTIDALEMTRIATALDLFHKLANRALGDPETQRIEITGAGGAPIEISQELARDDADRIAGVLSVLRDAGLGDLFGSDAASVRTLEAQLGADGVYTTEQPQ